MAEVKFSKGSDEWLMFMEFWKLCQKFWQPETNDDYWDSVIAEANSFSEKYQMPLARHLAVGFINSLEDVYKKGGKV